MGLLGIRVITLGCKVNQCDGDEIARALAERGYEIAANEEPADIFIINTCTVTATADAKARKLIRKLHREHPQARIIVTGCLAQRDPESVALLPGVSVVVANTEKSEIAILVTGLWPGEAGRGGAAVQDGGERPAGMGMPALQGARRTRAFLKIQDGCDHHCAYCIIPKVRGRPTSKPMSKVLAEIRRLAHLGAQEVVLCGIRLGAYGRDDEEGTLAALLHELREIEVPRLRLSSIEPMDVTEDLLAEIADHPRLCHHLHLPLQSGDDSILAAMGRGCTSAEYGDLVGRIRAAWPDAALTTDVMVAFPGETEEQFERTGAFVRKIGFTRVHVFSYSPRPSTPAAARPDQVPAGVRRDRAARMLAIARDLAQAAARSWVGQRASVLFEERGDDGRLSGLTPHYLRVRCAGPTEWIGRIVEVVPTREGRGELLADLDQ